MRTHKRTRAHVRTHSAMRTAHLGVEVPQRLCVLHHRLAQVLHKRRL